MQVRYNQASTQRALGNKQSLEQQRYTYGLRTVHKKENNVAHCFFFIAEQTKLLFLNIRARFMSYCCCFLLYYGPWMFKLHNQTSQGHITLI